MISDPSSLLALGGLCLKNSKLDKAEQMFRKFVELCVDDFRGHFMLGKVLYSKNEYFKSLECFEKAILLNADSVDSYGAAAAVAIKLNIPILASKYCNKVRTNMFYYIDINPIIICTKGAKY